jgi:hypothetical protein
MGDRAAGGEPLADGIEQALRQLLRAVHRHLFGSMGKRRIAEALANLRAVSGKIHARRRCERRNHFLDHQALDERRELGIG